MVEIGMGRTARRTYELSEISIVPSRRTRSSKDVSTAWQLDAYRFEIPVVAHPTDALVSPEFAIELGRLGGLGVLNGEGLIGRHLDVEAKIAQLLEAAAADPEPSTAIRLLQELHAAPLNPDLLGAAVARIREAGVTTAVRVSPQNAQWLTPVLVAAGIDLLVIQGTIVSAERVASDGEPLNLKTFISELDIPVVAGGVLDHRTALHLMRTGAAGVIVGYGSTQGVTTTDEVLGISVPMATAIADAAAMMFNRSRVSDDQIVLSAKANLAKVEQMIAQGQWAEAQDELAEVSSTVQAVTDGSRRQDLINEVNLLNTKVETRDPNATLRPGSPSNPAAPGSVGNSWTPLAPVVEPPTPPTPASAAEPSMSAGVSESPMPNSTSTVAASPSTPSSKPEPGSIDPSLEPADEATNPAGQPAPETPVSPTH